MQTRSIATEGKTIVTLNKKWYGRLGIIATAFVALLTVILWERHTRVESEPDPGRRAPGMDGGLVGRVLDQYGNVPIYDNGAVFRQSHGRHYSADGYYFGQKWQCVEYVKRFYYKAKGHAMPDVWGHAKDFFDPEVPDGGLNKRRGLLQFRNGGTARPAPEDILVFCDSTYGHVGIITKVTDDTVEIIQQNIYGKPRQTFRLYAEAGRYEITGPGRAAGWLRLPDGDGLLMKPIPNSSN